MNRYCKERTVRVKHRLPVTKERGQMDYTGSHCLVRHGRSLLSLGGVTEDPGVWVQGDGTRGTERRQTGWTPLSLMGLPTGRTLVRDRPGPSPLGR